MCGVNTGLTALGARLLASPCVLNTNARVSPTILASVEAVASNAFILTAFEALCCSNFSFGSREGVSLLLSSDRICEQECLKW